jgi:hypothetical protein
VEPARTRSDGALFDVESFGRYFLHDLVHHIADVRHGFAALVRTTKGDG